jgi:pSer/pThr/pTyr-binding forkhead associated (FHA) protein
MAGLTLTLRGGLRDGTTFELAEGREYLIGRGEGCDIWLGDAPEFGTVSRRHCIVLLDSQGARLRDLGSRNGTLLNGVQIGRPRHSYMPPDTHAATCRTCPLEAGDDLWLGAVHFSVAAPGPPVPPCPIPEGYADGVPMTIGL